MKYIKWSIILAACLVATSAFGAPFEPPVVTLTAHPVLSWAGGSATVTFDLAGRDCEVFLAIYTRGIGGWVPMQTNGMERFDLGMDYHTFGGIDTCVVVSAGEPFTIGNNRQITWDGKDKLGNPVELADYTYYLIANDAAGDPVPFGDYFGALGTMNGGWDPRFDQYSDPDSMLVGVNIGGVTSGTSHQKHSVQLFEEGVKLDKPRVLWRCSYYEIGQDSESGLWTGYQMPAGGMSYTVQKDPNNKDRIWYGAWDGTAESGFISSCILNVEGPADIVTDWGEDGKVWTYGSGRSAGHGVGYINGVLVMSSYDPTDTYSNTYVVDAETGDVLREIDMYDYFVSTSEDIDRGSRASEGPGFVVPSWTGDNYMVNVQWCACGRIGFNPFEDENWLYWANMNGDYYCDHGYPGCFNFDEAKAWMCNDCAFGKLNVCVTLDKYNFAIFDNHAAGPEAAEILGPDGYGICWLSQLSQVAANNKWWSAVVDNDTAYDGWYGLYTTGAVDDPEAVYQMPVWSGYDIAQSIISSGVGVEAGTPQEIALSADPNPFNPSTTISYGIVKTGYVSLEVYNIMGQKIATLYDGQRDAGTYSVRWDASDFSSGIYFAVMNTGNITKTEKMMLVK